jgi:hypothetical protein
VLWTDGGVWGGDGEAVAGVGRWCWAVERDWIGKPTVGEPTPCSRGGSWVEWYVDRDGQRGGQH